jgi:hypothetical protein
MPANGPREREYDSISARSDTSVSACASRPFGPAAAAASAPSLTLFFRMAVAPAWVRHQNDEVCGLDAKLKADAAAFEGDHEVFPERLASFFCTWRSSSARCFFQPPHFLLALLKRDRPNRSSCNLLSRCGHRSRLNVQTIGLFKTSLSQVRATSAAPGAGARRPGNPRLKIRRGFGDQCDLDRRCFAVRIHPVLHSGLRVPV